jgi:single-strand DNA-binding protein
MALSLNKVLLVGNVGKDPEVHYIDANSVVATFTLATSERGYTLPNGNEVPERTEWHNIVTWGNIAKRVENVLRKGCKVYIEGKIRTRTFDDKSGHTRYVTEILADKLDIFAFPQNTVPPTATPAPAQPE